MAKDKDPILEEKYFGLLFPRLYPVHSENMIISDFAHQLMDDKLFTISSLFEAVISKIGKIKRHNTEGMDFVDISDAKVTSVRTYGYGKSYGAPVTGIHTKRGLLRVICYERKQDKFYYFLIPYWAYKHIPKKSNIEIPFELDGTPKRINKCQVNWWDFEKKTLEEICVPDEETSNNQSEQPIVLEGNS